MGPRQGCCKRAGRGQQPPQDRDAGCGEILGATKGKGRRPTGQLGPPTHRWVCNKEEPTPQLQGGGPSSQHLRHLRGRALVASAKCGGRGAAARPPTGPTPGPARLLPASGTARHSTVPGGATTSAPKPTAGQTRPGQGPPGGAGGPSIPPTIGLELRPPRPGPGPPEL